MGFVPVAPLEAAPLSAPVRTARAVQTLPPIRFADPFAGDAPPSPAPASPAQTGAVILRAVVLGPAPRALVEENGTDRIVAAGDAIGGSILAAIRRDCIVLRDGRRIAMSVQPR